MIRKLGTLFILLALVIQLVPAGKAEIVRAASGTTGNFTFPNEYDTSDKARVTTDEKVTLKGTISNVDPKSISYSVYQIVDPANENNVANKRENLTSNISVSGFSLQVFNIQLFPGLNKITFKGTMGGGEVTNSIYIDYHNGPMLYNLTASLDGNNFPIVEGDTTVVQSQTSRGRTKADISITGNAPNAQQVSIIVNGASKTYAVNSTNDNSFAAAPITLQQGKNLVTIRIKNGTQTIETTRNIAFYNGNVTFYDVNINEVDTNDNILQSAALEYSPSFSYDTAANKLLITGSVIVPNSQYADVANGPLKPHPDPLDPLSDIHLAAWVKEASSASYPANGLLTPTNISIVGNPTVKDSFFIYSFEIDPTAGGSFHLDPEKLYNFKLQARNEENKRLNLLTEVDQYTEGLYLTLHDTTQPFVSQINYLQGFQPNNYANLEGKPLDGLSIYGLPVGIELLIGNPYNGATASIGVEINTKPLNEGTDYVIAGDDPNYSKNINGILTPFRRVVLQFDRLPFEGTQTIKVTVGSNTGSAKFTMIYGPYVNYRTITDGMTVYDDSTSSTNAGDIVTTKLGNFEGELQNINNTADILYDSGTAARTVYFYVNNVPFPLTEYGDGNKAHFILDTTVPSTSPVVGRTIIDDIYDAMFNGENIIRFVFQSANNSYEKIVKINKVPTNLPVIPAPDFVTEGVYPFTFDAMVTSPKPILNDPNFTKNGGLYTTKEPFMNVYGTFDFIDLGTVPSNIDLSSTDPSTAAAVAAARNQVIATIESKLTTLGTHASDYMLVITGASLAEPITWDLSQPFQLVQGDKVVGAYNPDNVSISGNLDVRYDLNTQSFQFLLKNQELNADGSSSVYLFNVYNSGATGPKATYRLEVDPTVLPYKVLRPYLPAEGIVNKNFIDVIIDAKGADKVTINKQAAERFKYDADNNPDNGVEYPNAFKATLSGLKPGVNKISFTIENASDKVSDSFEIKYAPTNIPGEQYLDVMKNSNKVFEGALTLSFPKGTTLVRRDFNDPNNLKGQVFTGNKLLFAIANPEDGVVDRREYDSPPKNFDLIMQNFGTRFKVSFPTRFSKSSPVYWIDGGLADDLSTPNYDPVTMGVDPYQYPGNDFGPGASEIPTYDQRPPERELVVSKRGTLTLSFDPSIRNATGTIVTVFRYDVDNKFWVNMGGVVDTKKNTITVPFDQFGYYVVGKMTYSFSDVTGHPYARNYMEAAYSKGLMNAANFDDFGGDMYTSRGEFTRMIVKALDIPLNYELSKPHFDDVPAIVNPDALWDYSYIETAAREGIIRGTQPRTFEPTKDLSRGDAAVFIARALNLKLETDPDKINAQLQKTFKDYADIDYYARASVLAIAKKGYIQGSPVDAKDPKKGYTYEPNSRLLRSDAAIIIGKMLADLKRLPKLN